MGKARVIPDNPDAIFLPYQGAWIADEQRLKLMEKGRQIGISWSTAYAGVARTGRQGARHDQWVSSRDDIQARLFLEDCKLFTGVLDMAARDLGEQVIDEATRQTAYVLSFATGKRINSMSSNPDAQAGKRGGRILDEFALHPDPRKLWSIAYPGITWGGNMEVISTHRGSHNFFNQLVREIKEGGNPVLLAAAALIAGIYLAWQNWDKIKPIIDRVAAAVTQWWNANVKPVLDKVMPLLRAITDFFRDYFGAGIEGIVKIISALLKGDFAGAWEAAKAAVSKMVTVALDMLKSLAPNAVASLRALYTGAKQWLQDKLGAVFNWLEGKLDAVGGWFFDLYDKVVGNSYVPDMVERIGEEMAKLEKLMVDPAQRATRSTKEAFRELASDVAGLIDRLFPVQAQIRAIVDDLAILDAALAAGAISKETHEAARRKLEAERNDLRFESHVAESSTVGDPSLVAMASLEGLKDIIGELPRIASDAEIALEEFGGRLGGGIMGALHDAIEGRNFFQSLKSMFQRTLQNIMHEALNGLETAIFGQGGLGGSLGSLFAGFFGTGGMIPPGQFGIVGERGPEPVIGTRSGARVLPNSSLRAGARGNSTVNLNFYGPVSNPEQVKRSAAQAGAALSRVVASGQRGI